MIKIKCIYKEFATILKRKKDNNLSISNLDLEKLKILKEFNFDNKKNEELFEASLYIHSIYEKKLFVFHNEKTLSLLLNGYEYGLFFLNEYIENYIYFFKNETINQKNVDKFRIETKLKIKEREHLSNEMNLKICEYVRCHSKEILQYVLNNKKHQDILYYSNDIVKLLDLTNYGILKNKFIFKYKEKQIEIHLNLNEEKFLTLEILDYPKMETDSIFKFDNINNIIIFLKKDLETSIKIKKLINNFGFIIEKINDNKIYLKSKKDFWKIEIEDDGLYLFHINKKLVSKKSIQDKYHLQKKYKKEDYFESLLFQIQRHDKNLNKYF